MMIKQIENIDKDLEQLVSNEFTQLAEQHHINVNYRIFNFIAEEHGEVLGVAKGLAYYNEVHISELLVLKNAKKKGIGSKLLAKVEDAFRDKGYDLISLNTYAFQAPNFYLKNGFELEYKRENKENPKLTRYYFKKEF